MSSFEKEYYEAESFWQEGMVLDEANINRIEKTISLIPADVKTLADIGCGNGVFLNKLKISETSLDILGIDRSKAALSYVNAKKMEGDISNIPLDDNSIDCLTCLEVIEHLPVNVYGKALEELARVSSKYLIVSVPFAEKLEDAYTKCPQCKSIFNTDMHLRSFDEKTFISLFDKLGFKNTSFQKLGEIKTFVWKEKYVKIFYPEQVLAWNSPICPICGFQNEQQAKVNNMVSEKESVKQKKSIISYFSALPKLIWPQKTRYYWIIGLFEKSKQK